MGSDAPVFFSDTFTDNNNYRLFEFPDEGTLQELLKNDGSVKVKGGPNDEAVLCTANKTYTLRLAESSNTLLLGASAPKVRARVTGKRLRLDDAESAEGTEAGLEIETAVSAHFELLRSAPRTSSLLTLLSARPYNGTAEQHANVLHRAAADAVLDLSARPSLAYLESSVQCSSSELREALRHACALCVDERWCVLDEQLERDIIETILSLAVEKEWSLSALPAVECVSACLAGSLDTGADGEAAAAGFDELSVRHCLCSLSDQTSLDWDAWLAAPRAAHFALDPAKICCFRAKAMLSDCDSWPRERFFEAWHDNLPTGLTPEASHLEGIAIILTAGDNASVGEDSVQALSLASLPSQPKERFAALFGVKPTWRMEELMPYLRDILDPGKSAQSLVLQFGCSVTANDGSVTYVSRYS